jgi:hypothetical protein
MSQAHARVDGWDSTVDTIKSELEHPSDTIQMMPHQGNPYVKNYMNMGDPEEVVPLRAKTLTTTHTPTTSRSQSKSCSSPAKSNSPQAKPSYQQAKPSDQQAKSK